MDSVSLLNQLSCSGCGRLHDPFAPQGLSACCRRPLVAGYNLSRAPDKAVLRHRPATLWRYREVLPVLSDRHIVTLGEGFTPLLPLPRLAGVYGLHSLLLKDEGNNPTGSFKARGLSMAISKASELGVAGCIIPTAGNAGVALAAYCARAGMKAVVVMPRHTPRAFQQECYWYGAELHLVEGLINDCAARAQLLNAVGDLLDVSTLKEPYRLEGKKTMGYEIAEQLDWQLPDVILYPAGGGTGLIGIWKAFAEMQAMGWLPAGIKLPRMVAVQARNCQPLVDTFTGKQADAQHYRGNPTLANGLAVPRPVGEAMMLKVLQESGGTAIGIAEEEMLEGVAELSRQEGLFVAPEGAATWMAVRKLLRTGWLSAGERILLLNTGSGGKYLENLEGKYHARVGNNAIASVPLPGYPS